MKERNPKTINTENLVFEILKRRPCSRSELVSEVARFCERRNAPLIEDDASLSEALQRLIREERVELTGMRYRIRLESKPSELGPDYVKVEPSFPMKQFSGTYKVGEEEKK